MRYRGYVLRNYFFITKGAKLLSALPHNTLLIGITIFIYICKNAL